MKRLADSRDDPASWAMSACVIVTSTSLAPAPSFCAWRTSPSSTTATRLWTVWKDWLASRSLVARSRRASEAALREVREEAGVVARLIEPLGDVRYWYTREGRRIAKVVSFFLLAYVSGEVDDHDFEVERASWMALEDAARELTYAGEREMAARALSRTRTA